MIKTFRKLLAVAGILILPALAQTASASHLQGSELTYQCLAPNIYVVTCKIYRDCTGATAPTSLLLSLKSPGCNAGRNVNLTRLGGSTIGDPYCAAIPKTCSTVRPNYEEAILTATVIFSSAEVTCPDWTLSINECCRPESTNLLNPQTNLYSEAYLKLSPSINNNSPEFDMLVVPYINYHKPIMISANAKDIDGDSLVYSLQSPLSGPGTPIVFKTYPQEVIFNSDSTKWAITPAGTYSAASPLHAYYINWSQPMPITPTPAFNFDPLNGSISFIPARYKPNTPPVQGENKYVMVVQVDEYRKINGVMTKIGSVRRDMFITIFDCGANENPNIAGPTANGQALAPTDVINLIPGSPLTFRFNSADGNPNDMLHFASDVSAVLPGAGFTSTGGNKPSGTITWTPTAAHVRSQPFYFHVSVMDNACPVKGYQTHTYAVRVSNTGAVTGLKAEAGSKLSFIAFPNPFAQTVSFKVNVTKPASNREIVIYNTLGQEVDRIQLNKQLSGEQQVVWQYSAKLPNGQYVARLVEGREVTQTIQFSKMQ
jgi:hypothetical protein